MCRHQIDRVTFSSLMAGYPREYRCCKCGKRIRQTFLSVLIRHILYYAIIYFGAWLLIVKMRLDSLVIVGLIIATSMLIEGAIYMRFFARYREIENGD